VLKIAVSRIFLFGYKLEFIEHPLQEPFQAAQTAILSKTSLHLYRRQKTPQSMVLPIRIFGI